MANRQSALLVALLIFLPSLPACVAWVSSLVLKRGSHNKGLFHQRGLGSVKENHAIEDHPSETFTAPNSDGSFGWTDAEFEAWILQELIGEAPELYENYTEVFHRSATCIKNWRERYRGNSLLWKRLFKRDRVVKEVIEAIPIVDAVDRWVCDLQKEGGVNQNITIIDLCSGKGYLSMILSEYLPSESVQKCVLVDKAWPMCFAEPQPHHMNWDHIYSNYTDGGSYFTTWPIPLHTSKQNLKIASSLRNMEKRLSKDPVLVLGVHLCGTLSIQAIKLFHQLPQSKLMILKPCCLPGMQHTQQENFEVGRYHFPTKDVCAPGKFVSKAWKGQPRWQLEGKFDKWCMHLHEALKEHDDVKSSKMSEIRVQTKGGFQNTFLFAEK
jgi:hypothetical protein